MVAAPVGHHCPTCVAEARREYRQGPGRRVAISNAKATSVTSALLVLIGIGYALEVVTGGAASLFGGPSALDLVRVGASVGLAPIDGGSLPRSSIAAGAGQRRDLTLVRFPCA